MSNPESETIDFSGLQFDTFPKVLGFLHVRFQLTIINWLDCASEDLPALIDSLYDSNEETHGKEKEFLESLIEKLESAYVSVKINEWTEKDLEKGKFKQVIFRYALNLLDNECQNFTDFSEKFTPIYFDELYTQYNDEVASIGEKVQEWAEANPVRSESANRIMKFLSNPSCELHLNGQNLDSLPDIFDNLAMRFVMTHIHLSNNKLQDLPDSFYCLNNLYQINLNENQVEVVSSSISNLHNLMYLNLSDNKIQTLPDSIGDLSCLRELRLENNKLQTIPRSIASLDRDLNLRLYDNHLSLSAIELLREIQLRGIDVHFDESSFDPSVIEGLTIDSDTNQSLQLIYTKANRKDFISLEKSYPNLHFHMQNSDKEKTLQSWLARLSLMKPNKNDGDDGFAIKILYHLDFAERNDLFRESFFRVIEGAAKTCGDRVALSVLHLGLAHTLQSFDKRNLREFANFLIHGPWMIDQLEKIAQGKISELRSLYQKQNRDIEDIEEIEVYLAYPIKLKEALEIHTDVEEMLYFSSSDVTESDLSNAENFVKDLLSEPNAIETILIERDDWIKALEENYPSAMAAFKRQKDFDLERINENDVMSYEKIQKQYTQNILAQTKKVLRS